MVRPMFHTRPSQAGVDSGWRVVRVAGQDCSEKSSADIQGLLRLVNDVFWIFSFQCLMFTWFTSTIYII